MRSCMKPVEADEKISDRWSGKGKDHDNEGLGIQDERSKTSHMLNPKDGPRV